MKVNEIFGPTIQGEGPSQGKQVMFVRLAFCNLACSWCDSKYTWDWKHHDRAKEVHEMDIDTILGKLHGCDSVVISGGEPLLQQNGLIPLVASLRASSRWVEIETNGTIVPRAEILAMVNQINCSPKLSNSGDSRAKRVNDKALKVLSSSEKVYFKFVISCEEDINEVIEYVQTYNIKSDHVYLMPLGKTPGELVLTTAMVRELAHKHGFVFSSRLHIELWGQKRGV